MSLKPFASLTDDRSLILRGNYRNIQPDFSGQVNEIQRRQLMREIFLRKTMGINDSNVLQVKWFSYHWHGESIRRGRSQEFAALLFHCPLDKGYVSTDDSHGNG